MRRRLSAASLLATASLAAMNATVTTTPIQECRTAATAATTKTTGPGFSAETTTNCRYDQPSKKSTCTNKYSDTFGTKTTTVAVTWYEAPADVVDETTVVPPRRRSIRSDTSSQGPRGSLSSTLVNTYDEQKRLVTEIGSSGPVVNFTTTYTKWDASGRPTAGKSVTKSGTNSLTLAYNDATRTLKTTTEAGRSVVVCEQTFDRNGNPASTACRSGGGQPNVSKITTTATEKICR